ncbi:MAG: 3-deoxy-D-manno-octulosonic acid transferase [Bacteroidales bacterium]|jgi:3-deoxy-D-manno-octulosonic-acid transferase|nr:3-deoxy-D-manno-octulosonic acid transferase [Bacteroidales bacterium]
MYFIYSFGILIYGLGLRIAAIFNHKARLWVNGRKALFCRVAVALKPIDRKKNPVIWFHASSLGEFEQGRPVMEAFKEDHPNFKILLTFFSPSGFEIRKTYDKADFVFYLPLDTPANARKWVDLVNPRLVIFIKYDFWFNILNALHQKAVPVYFISALFRPEQHFFKRYGRWFRDQLDSITWFFVQNESSEQLLRSIGKQNVTKTGDTRFDRVYSIAQHKQPFPLIEKFCAGEKIFIGGSTWKEDEDVILPLTLLSELTMKFIIAPHNVSRERIESITGRLKRPFILYSEMNEGNVSGKEILIMDSVGILSQLYQYAALSFIGGGFGVSIHNIQEPITFGVPVFFGPGYHKFKEATDLVSLGGAFCIQTAKELEIKVMEILSDPEKHQRLSSICRNYVEENRGATGIIMTYLNTTGSFTQ